uniref:NAD(P)-dependent oxidoreductase n=1 Tax=Eubacterium cellulosolvens TaxID=29322 RepID=UPI0006867ACA|nr:NAD(P)-dependent oxidoreductase [[Eubacterium] cellulosolvens]
MGYKGLIMAELDTDMIKKNVPDIDFDVAGYGKNKKLMSSEEIADVIGDYDVLVSEFETIDAHVLEAAKKLKLIVCCRGGVKSVIDLPKAEELGVRVENNVGRNANAVVEVIFGYMLDWARNIEKSNRQVHDGTLIGKDFYLPDEYRDSLWGFGEDSPYVALRGRSLSSMTIGIVGYGHIGRAVAERANAFGMDVLVYDPMCGESNISDNVRKVSLDELMETSDVVTLHCPVTKDNRDMMSYHRFRQMKKDALFINAARGGLVDEEALAWALKNHEIDAAAIDVAKQEPLPPDSVLLSAPNLTITPHIAGASDEVIRKGTEMVIHKLTKFVGSDPAV